MPITNQRRAMVRKLGHAVAVEWTSTASPNARGTLSTEAPARRLRTARARASPSRPRRTGPIIFTVLPDMYNGPLKV